MASRKEQSRKSDRRGSSDKSTRQQTEVEIINVLCIDPVPKPLPPEVEIFDIRSAKPDAEPEKIIFRVRSAKPSKINPYV